MQEGGGGERRDRTQAELGRRLAVAGGYRVLASDGTHLGWLDHVRYLRHADHPDEIIVRGRRLLATRRRVLPFSAVAEVRQRDSTRRATRCPDSVRASRRSTAQTHGGRARRAALDEVVPKALRVLNDHLDKGGPDAWRAALRIFEHQYGRAPEQAEEPFVMPTTVEEVEKLSWGQLLYLAGQHADELGGGTTAEASS